MEEYNVGPILEKVIESLSHYVQDQFRWQTGMKKELESLRDNYPKIQAVVSTAKRTQIEDLNSALNKWIWQLRDAIDEADDLLDDFEYMKYKKPDLWQNFIKVGKRALKIDPNLKRLEKIVQKLDRVSAKVSIFLHLLENREQEQREKQVELHKTRQTGSLPKDDLIGRRKDKESIIEWLRKPSIEEHQTHVTSTTSYTNISLLSIVGDGGMGKTTLLQHVYQDEIMKEFDLKMWVCVSDSFDVNKVIKDMLECIENEMPSLDSLHALQQRLTSKVMSKKLLLVLDDLWDKEEEALLHEKWGKTLAPLANGGLGSKILITTRTGSVASMIAKVINKKNNPLTLKGLEDDECLQILTTHAFVFGENPDDHKNLKSIAGELVKKVYGCPLVAKVMGGVLNSSLDEGHWRNVLNNSLSLNGIISILKLSYIFLPKHLQSCFSFCSIFEQDHVFDKNDLVRMWIAVGFIQPSHNNQGEALTLEDIGARYFDDLIKKSLFDKVSTRQYKMHDLLHELAQSVSKQECFRFVCEENSLLLEIPETVRHLSVTTGNPEVLKNIGRFKNLRTLLITSDNQSLADALNEMLKVTRNIRLLHIYDDFDFEVMPENIGYLHHLRYLRFPVYEGKLLPRSLSSLYHLQFIRFDNNDYVMNNLFYPRYSRRRNFNFPGIGKLKFLRQLDNFYIENKNGYRIEELEHMNELRILNIKNLENVKDAKEAYNAKLCDKRKLMHLSLYWAYANEFRLVDERVLDNLQPHNYLKALKINNYMGARSAIWMKEAHLINNLQEIELHNCMEWEILPPFGQLPFLKTLCLYEMPKVKRLENKFHGNDMRCVFPSLQTLSFHSMNALVDWFDPSVVDDFFSCLTELRLVDCPNLQELPYLPPKLELLDIKNIGWKTLNCCSISNSIPLESLVVYNCPKMTSISLAGALGKLEHLALLDLPLLESLTNISREQINYVYMRRLPRLRNKLLRNESVFNPGDYILAAAPYLSPPSRRNKLPRNESAFDSD